MLGGFHEEAGYILRVHFGAGDETGQSQSTNQPLPQALHATIESQDGIMVVVRTKVGKQIMCTILSF